MISIPRQFPSREVMHELGHIPLPIQGGRRLGHAGYIPEYSEPNKTNTLNTKLPTFVDYLAGLSQEQHRLLLKTAKKLHMDEINCLITLNQIKDQAIIVSLAVTKSSDDKNMWNLRIYDASGTDAMSDSNIIEYLTILNSDPLTRAPLVTQPARYSNFEELINILDVNYLSNKKTYCGFKPGFLL